MKTLLKQVCSLILALLMVLSVVSVPTFSAKAEDGENPPSAMTLNEALNVEGGTIEFTNSGDYIDSENGNYIWRVEDDHIASPETGLYQKKAVITAEITANEGEIVAFDFICDVLDYSYVSGGLLFSIDDRPLESGRGFGYAGYKDWTHKEYALTAGKHTLKWVFQLSTNATSGRAKLDNVYVGEPVHPSEIVLQDTAEVGVNCRVPLTYEVLPEEAFNKDVVFTSSDESIAVVLEDGNVVGMKTGTATITAATVDGGLIDTCEVTVIESEVGSAELFAYDGVYSREQSKWHTVLYKFSSGLPERAEVAAELSSEEVKDCNVVSCAYVGGKIYGYMTSGYREFRYIVIDEATQTVDYWGRTNMLHPQSMAYDYSTNTMYAVAYASQSSSKYALYSVDIDTGDLTMIAELSENVTEIAVSLDGKIYGFLAHTINEIDKATGEVKRLFYFQAPDGYSKIPWKAVCDFQTGLFYVLYQSRTNSQGNINHNLYEINVDDLTARSCGYVTVNNKSGTRDMFIKNDIELPPREKTKFTVTFADSMDGSVIGTAQYEVGTTLDETTFPTPPEHEGYAFTCWEYDENYDGEYLLYDTTVTAYYHEEEAPATIIIDNAYIDHFYGGEDYGWKKYGIQFLLDADATAYGTAIDAENDSYNGTDDFYSEFEYTLPEEASKAFTPRSVMFRKKLVLNIPAGTYDWCFTHLSKNEGTSDDNATISYDYVGNDGNVTSRYDDFMFEAGYTYSFKVSNSKIDMEVTRGNVEQIFSESIEFECHEIQVYGGRYNYNQAKVLPTDTFDKTVEYESSDPTVAIVIDNSIFGLSEGTATITATPTDGHAEPVSFEVTVLPERPTVDFYGYIEYVSGIYRDVIPYTQIWCKYTDSEGMRNSQTFVSESNEAAEETVQYNIVAAAYAGGKVYGYRHVLDSCNRRMDFFSMDVNSDSKQLVPIISDINVGLDIRDMAYDHSTDTMYAIAINEEFGRSLSLYTVDLSLGVLTEVAPLTGVDDEGREIYVLNFVIDGNGHAYGINEFDHTGYAGTCTRNYLLDINLTTGEVRVNKEIRVVNGSTAAGTSGSLCRYYDSVSTTYDYANNQILYSYSGLLGSIIPDTGELIWAPGYYGAQLSCMFIVDDIPTASEVEKPQFTITFIDDYNGSIICTETVEGGIVLDKATFPNAPEHDGMLFRGWNYYGDRIISDVTIKGLYSQAEYQTAVVKLSVDYEGNSLGSNPLCGYHMLIDSDAEMIEKYGQRINLWFSNSSDEGREKTDAFYSEFEYSVPRNACGSEEDALTVLNSTLSVRVPSGVYDWFILEENQGMCVAHPYEDIGGRFDDFEFVAGYVYEFKVRWKGIRHAIDLEITPIVPDENPDAGVCVLLGEIAGNPGEEIETEVVIEGDYEANSFDMALEYDASDIEVLEITPGQVIQEIVENGGEFDLQQGSGTGSGGSGSSDASTGTIDAKAESGGMAFGGNGQIMKMKVKIPEDAEAGEKNMDMTVNDLSKNNSDGTTEQIPHYDVTGNSATGSIGGGGSGGSGGGSGGIGGGGGGGVVTDPTTPIPTGEPTPTGEPVPAPTPNPNASFFVTFVDWDGRTIAIKTAKYGEAATPPPDPERENFIFVGWEGDFSCVTANTAVLAKYGPIPNSGDASGDGTVNAVDALVAMRYVIGVSTENLTPEQIAAADFNGDGAVNAVDTLLIMRFSLGLIEAVVSDPEQGA